MSFLRKNMLRGVSLAGLLLAMEPVHAEYLRIQLRVYGLDCEICARGVASSVQRIAGVKSVNVSLKTGMLEIVLTPGSKFKMSDLRRRIRENGFRSMEATVTAIGRFNGSRFEVLGSGESYDLDSLASKAVTPGEVTFDVR
jgi:cation transport ATPase